MLHPEKVPVDKMKVYDFFQGTKYALYYLEQELRHLADDKLSFCLIEIVYGDFEVKLEINEV